MLPEWHPFAAASGLHLFTAANGCLTDLGVATPPIVFAGHALGADLAIVDDIGGSTLESILREHRSRSAQPITELRRVLMVLSDTRMHRFGKVAFAKDKTNPTDASTCESLVLQRCRADLDDAVTRVPRFVAHEGRLRTVMSELYSRIEARSSCSLVHGELGPDHVLVDQHGQPNLIDIEGMMYFDVEWEHAFLGMRFHRHYEALEGVDLDMRRLEFYRFAQHLSLVVGPLRLLEGDFPDRAFMSGIVEHNIGWVLSFVDDFRSEP